MDVTHWFRRMSVGARVEGRQYGQGNKGDWDRITEIWGLYASEVGLEGLGVINMMQAGLPKDEIDRIMTEFRAKRPEELEAYRALVQGMREVTG